MSLLPSRRRKRVKWSEFFFFNIDDDSDVIFAETTWMIGTKSDDNSLNVAIEVI